MRSYPRNSTHAAARIVALAMLADGHLSREELDTFVHRAAGDPALADGATLDQVLAALCADLMFARQLAWDAACRVDGRTLEALLSEVDDPQLRRRVAQLCAAVVEADEQVSDGESRVLDSAVAQWGLQRDILRPVAA